MVRYANFVVFYPRKSYVLTQFKIPQNENATNRLDESGLAVVSYDSSYGYYRVRVRQDDHDEHRDLILDLIREAHDAFRMT